VDINAAVGREQGITDEQLAELAEFERSAKFDAREKAVLRLAESMTRTPADVSDAAFDELARHFDTAQIVELVSMVALENFRARFNRALHVESEGFCALPSDHPVRKALPPFRG
jgi:alkylhydroperoxidase family enzyme